MSNRDWDQGFAISGRMTTHAAVLSCLLDKNLNSPMTYGTCYTETTLCQTLKALNTWYLIVCSRVEYTTSGIEISKGELTIDDITSTLVTEGNSKYKATISELFNPGNLILGTKKYGRNYIGFNGYIRELRLWNTKMSVNHTSLLRNYMIDPSKHSNLIGYWPLVSGGFYNFFEESGCSIQDISEDTSNPSSAKVYGNTASEWVTGQDLQTTAICHKGYIYYPQTASCIKNVRNLALYLDSTQSACGSDNCVIESNKEVIDELEITLSIWVYRSKILSTYLTTIFGIKDLAEIRVSNDNKLNINYCGSITTPMNVQPEEGKWAFYAGSLSKSLQYSTSIYDSYHMVSQTSLNAISFPPTVGFVIGHNLDGYIREAKIWSRSLVSYEFDSSGKAIAILNDIMREKY